MPRRNTIHSKDGKKQQARGKAPKTKVPENAKGGGQLHLVGGKASINQISKEKEKWPHRKRSVKRGSPGEKKK